MGISIDITKTLVARTRRFILRARLEVDGGRLVLFGPSGSGKSLTLQAIAGLLRPDAGSIRLNGRPLFDAAAGIHVPPRGRRIGFVFQDYALFPHMTVRQNVAFPLRSIFRRVSPASVRRIEETLELFGLTAVADARPGRISGGQRQRVALARAVVGQPQALLLDEPFAALDIPLRRRLREELMTMLDRLSIPLVLVTHDPADVLAFGGEVAIYKDGAVTEVLRLATGGAAMAMDRSLDGEDAEDDPPLIQAEDQPHDPAWEMIGELRRAVRHGKTQETHPLAARLSAAGS